MTNFFFVSQYSINDCKLRLVSLEEVYVLNFTKTNQTHAMGTAIDTGWSRCFFPRYSNGEV